MELNEKQRSIIIAETSRVFPQEAVIAITEDNAIALVNIHDKPEEHFKVDPEIFFSYNPIALVHSHPVPEGTNKSYDGITFYDPRSASGADLTTQQQLDIPFGICAYDGINFEEVVWFPDVTSPLIGMPYIHGITDCYRILRAYYWQTYKIMLMDYPRTFNWWNEEQNLYADNFSKEGFYEVREQDLVVGDIMFMKIHTPIEGHAAVYIGNGKIIHHFNNRLSNEDDLGRWRKKISRFLHHKNVSKDGLKRID